MAEARPRSGLRWVAMLVLLAVALFVGSGVLDRRPPTQAERIAALESSLKCPSCQELSVAQSTSPSSLAVRREIRQGVRSGQSDQQIVASLRGRYGTAVDLTPTGGISAILWVIPALLVLVLLIVVVLSLRRRRLSAGGR